MVRHHKSVPFCLGPWRSMFFSISILLLSLIFIYFRFRHSKEKWIGNDLPNRRNAAIRFMFFFSFIMRIAYWRNESVCVLRQCAANCKKSPRNTNWKLKTLQYCCVLPNGASLRQYIGANSNVLSLVLTLRFANNSPRLAYSSGHCLFILLYWCGNGNT